MKIVLKLSLPIKIIITNFKYPSAAKDLGIEITII
jgi:hypothetical protein